MNDGTRNATATSDRSPPDSSDSRLIFLPGGRASTSTPVVSHVVGLGQHQPAPRRPGRALANTRSRLSSTVAANASAKTCSIRLSTSSMTVEQVLAGLTRRSSSCSERN